MTAQKEEWAQDGLWHHLQNSYFESSIAAERSDFFTAAVYNTKCQETQNKIFVQQLKTQKY